MAPFTLLRNSLWDSKDSARRTRTLSSVPDDSPARIRATYIDDNVAQSHHMNKDTEPLESYANIVETGIGYDYDKPYPYNKPRPFFENSVEELKNGLAKQFLKDALKKRGLKVE